ncbi:AarF/ABC1/UbiB kinase family protein [Leptolyngbya sp. FACHB-261]|nr:AarF/ABC1/UbiB kinase family protein [Leptolyngbya sp. FACHB-261]
MRRLLTGGKPDEPRLPTPRILRNILVELGPAFVKLGQLLSTRPDLLSPEYITELSTLQDEVPPVAWEEVEIVLRSSLPRPLEEVFAEVSAIPVAAGSIAQIHRARLAGPEGREVALKIQRPGIEAIVRQDMQLLQSIAELVSRTDFGQYYDLVSLAEEFSTALQAELDFTEEGQSTEQLRDSLQNTDLIDSKQLIVPEIIWELTSQRLLVMQWLSGEPVLAHDRGPAGGPIAVMLVRAFFQQIYIDGFFHADPHPGNIFYLQDGRIALIDCGMVGRLDPRTQQLLTQQMLAIVNLDARRCSQIILELGEPTKRLNLVQLERDYDRLLRRYYNRSLSQINFAQLFYEVLRSTRKNGVRVPGNMGLYVKTLANLEGVARSLDPEFNLMGEVRPLVADLFRRQLIGSTPLQDLMMTALDLKSLSLESPRQIETLLDRLATENLQWNVALRGLDPLRRSLDDSANRLSFSVLVGSLILGAAIISSSDIGGQTPVPLVWISSVLFATASFLGLWLIVSILRSGRLR